MSKRLASQARVFNDGKSCIHMAWSHINQAWIVWRQDGADQRMMRIYNDKWEAQEDYDARVKFIEEMESLI